MVQLTKYQLGNLSHRFSLSTLFEKKNLLLFAASHSGWVRILQGISHLCLPSNHRNIEITDECYCIWLYMGSGNLNLGPLICTANTLPTEPFPKPHCCILQKKVPFHSALVMCGDYRSICASIKFSFPPNIKMRNRRDGLVAKSPSSSFGDLGLIPSTHTVIHNLLLWGCDALFWLHRQGMDMLCRHTYKQHINNKNKSFSILLFSS